MNINRTVVGLVFLSFALACSIYALNFHGYSSVSPEGFAQFGDFMGGVLNPVFSAFAIFLLIHSLRQQNKVIEQQEDLIKQQNSALEIQKDELKLSREELKNSNKISDQNLKLQNKKYLTPIIQNFHQKRYELLLTVFNESRQATKQDLTGSSISGSLNKAFKILGKSDQSFSDEEEKIFSWYQQSSNAAELKSEARSRGIEYFETALSLIEFTDYSVAMDSLEDESFFLAYKLKKLEIISEHEHKNFTSNFIKNKEERLLSKEANFCFSKGVFS